MKAKIACFALIWLGAVALAAGCDDEDTDPGTPTGGGGGEPAPKPAGGQCVCDLDCEGDDALCLLGMCVRRAYGFCDFNDRQFNCDPGFQCFNTDIFLETGTCWPVYDTATCEFVENRHGVCSPVRGDGCSPECGSACNYDTVPETAPGSACVQASQCTGGSEAECWRDTGQLNPFVDGYCVGFYCTSDEECGLDAACTDDLFTYGGAPIGACVNTCGMDLDCRPGYLCRNIDGWDRTFCWYGCDDAATCPEGYTCSGSRCLDSSIACSADNPHGVCPMGYWCDDGVCSDEPFVCTASDADQFEPNETRATATDAPAGDTHDLTLCPGDEDWFEITVPAGTLMRVGIDFLHDRGDIDLVAYDANGEYLGSRMPKYWIDYPYPATGGWRDYEWNTEYFGFYSESGGDTYYVRVVGFDNAENRYALHVDAFPYVDGFDCEAAGFTTDECRGHGDGGSGLLPFPFPDPNDSFLGDAYFFEQMTSGRFARREVIMLLRHALRETMQAFPGTTPFGIGDICQIDGITPYTEVAIPHHPATTHDQGGNVDVAYFQTDGTNDLEVICGDGTPSDAMYCSSAAAETHIVDLKRQAFFMAKLYDSPRIRVLGVDQVIAPLIRGAAEELNALPDTDPQHVTASELSAFNSSKMAYGAGWNSHHHHVHVSFQWWTSASKHPPTAVKTPDRMVSQSSMQNLKALETVQPGGPITGSSNRTPVKLRLLGTK